MLLTTVLTVMMVAPLLAGATEPSNAPARPRRLAGQDAPGLRDRGVWPDRSRAHPGSRGRAHQNGHVDHGSHPSDAHGLPAFQRQEHRRGIHRVPRGRVLEPGLGSGGNGGRRMAPLPGDHRDRPQVSGTAPCGRTRARPAPGPLLDAQRAVSLVRSKAREWDIDPNHIGIGGFSAGGHLALAAATNFDRRMYAPLDAIDKVSCRPDFAVAAYPGYLVDIKTWELRPSIRIPAGTPPVFLVHAFGDTEPGASPAHSAVMFLALAPATASRKGDSSPLAPRAKCEGTTSAWLANRSSFKDRTGPPLDVAARCSQTFAKATVGNLRVHS